MLVNPFRALLALVAIAGVSAQSLNLSDCGEACLTSSAANSTCDALTNVTCACTDTTFQNALANCIGTCTNATGDLSQLQNYQKAACNSSTNSTSTNSSRTSLTPSTSTPTSKSNSTSNASGTNPFEQLPLLSALIAIAGATIVGAFA